MELTHSFGLHRWAFFSRNNFLLPSRCVAMHLPYAPWALLIRYATCSAFNEGLRGLNLSLSFLLSLKTSMHVLLLLWREPPVASGRIHSRTMVSSKTIAVGLCMMLLHKWSDIKVSTYQWEFASSSYQAHQGSCIMRESRCFFQNLTLFNSTLPSAFATKQYLL